VGHEWRAQLRAGLVVGVGLLLALAATLGPLPGLSADPGASLSVRLPDLVRAAVLVLLALSGLLLLALQRPRRSSGSDPLAVRGYQRRSAWAAILALLPFVILLAVAWYLAWAHRPGEDAPIERAIGAIAGLLDLLARARKPPTSVPFFDLTVATLLLLAALGLFALMLVVTLAERLETWWAARMAVDVAPAVRAARADDDDLRAVADPRRAIIRAYGRYEHVLAAAQSPRAPWQTPSEFMRTTLARLPVPSQSVERLTALFEAARFSDRPLDGAARDAACDCLDAITVALADETRAR
jgi:hypothetical protein